MLPEGYVQTVRKSGATASLDGSPDMSSVRLRRSWCAIGAYCMALAPICPGLQHTKCAPAVYAVGLEAEPLPEPLPIPDRVVLEEQVRRLLERARARLGATVPQFVEGLGGLQAKGAGTRRSWYDWLEKPETVSALTALAALHILGPTAAMELLFQSQSAPSTPGADSHAEADRLTELEAQIATLAELVRGLQQSMEVVQEQLLQAGVRRQERSPATETMRTPT